MDPQILGDILPFQEIGKAFESSVQVQAASWQAQADWTHAGSKPGNVADSPVPLALRVLLFALVLRRAGVILWDERNRQPRRRASCCMR